MSKNTLDHVEVANRLGKWFDVLPTIEGKTYKDLSTAVIVPTRGEVNHKVIQALINMVRPVNQYCQVQLVKGHEVAVAYNEAVKAILAQDKANKIKYLMTIEDDNVVPIDALVKLLESIEATGFSAMSGLYFAKSDFGFPMAFGNPQRFRDEGVMDFGPRWDVKDCVEKGAVMEVNGIAMGCAIWRMELFRAFEYPWFTTYQKIENGLVGGQTQDLFFSKKLRDMGHRLGVDCRVKVGHIDRDTDEIW